ncbi:nicotinate-nucleotide adenylyltransferase [Neosynechococcus sphagnicola sy1]|uniref:Probable nicotinate-nucleotide adenylyltransferase n=1 Tax=Neosynechococcus sphagnicola sy1 TaxID=1497020 RepID=A0A098TNJ6_9CYAN|nr:nicotinate-nucleotide adenylyltransferase [Neosynechococcus sphagnicola]KGF73905.1 nicotinate-nucleotide adenylyltransferase [Neosynechococcus sphagnicola sy1]
MKTIALFGTSADPPTTGHQSILRWLSQHFDWVAVWAADNPFKSHSTCLEHRMAMLHLLIAATQPAINNVGLYAELSSPRTLETVERARQRWPHAHFTLVIGSDLLAQLPQWYHISELLERVHLLVIPRPGYGITAAHLEKLKGMGAIVAIADLPGLNVSSTAYRENRESEELPPPIAAYIHQQQLYSCQDASLKRRPIHPHNGC